MHTMIGSLFSGYNGLDMAAQNVFGLPLGFVADIEPGPCKILAHHHPDVPNLGDVTAIDWTEWRDRITVLTGGFPCTDVSLAGRQAGLIRGETRSGLWSEMQRAIVELRPRFVLIENVRGLLSAPADIGGTDDSYLEPCPWCVGDGTVGNLRALGAVLGDLADAGYDARWCGLRAADVGACHGRFRVFILAHARDADRVDSYRRCATGLAWEEGPAPRSTALMPTPRASDAFGAGAHGDGGPDLRTVVSLLPTPRATDGTKGGPNQRGSSGDLMLPSAVHHNFGKYGAAVERHAAVLGRPAPDPTERAPRGGRRLSARFVEWVMMLPEGHVTGVPGLSRNAQLRLLGNGVVPIQAEAALRHMLAQEVAA